MPSAGQNGMLPRVTEPDQLARDAAARAALELIEPETAIGLGSGRAVWRVIELLGERGDALRAACASDVTRERAEAAGIDVIELDGDTRLAVAIDGADEVDPALGLIKGGGAALLREKIVVAAAARFVVVAETKKRVGRLGDTRGLPVEVVRFGWRDTRRRLLELDIGAADLREEGGEPVITDEGHLLLDCELPRDGDLDELGEAIKATVGVVEHGLFLGMASEALLGTPEGDVEVIR
jgi:ribose 5-phosphate isomerase A